MEIYYDVITLPNYNPQCRDAIFNIISKYSNKFSTSGNAVIRVDNSFDVQFLIYSGYLRIDDRLTNILTNSTTYTTMVMISDTMFYFLCKSNDSANTPVGGFCWIKEDGKNYFGVSPRMDSSLSCAIENMTFSDKTSSPENRYYTIKKHANFTLAGSAIVFISASIIGDNGGNFKVLSGVRSCSTTTFDTMVTINHRNYYAIGTNTLVLDA